MDFRFHISSSARPPGTTARRSSAATFIGRALAFVLAFCFLVVAGVLSLLVFSVLAGGVAVLLGTRLVTGRRSRTTFHTIDVTPVKPSEPAPISRASLPETPSGRDSAS